MARAPSPKGASLREAIYDRIVQAVMEHRLPPGTQLVEDRLATLFDTSRAQVREVLARLSHEGVVETIPNRGSFIAAPTAEQARQIFEARRLIEPALVRRLIGRRGPMVLAELQTLVEQEHAARKRQDRSAIVRLSGEFHVALARAAGNAMLERTMRELTSLTCLIIFLYDAPHATACRDDEHAELLRCIERKRADRAVAMMLEHLDHIESSLDLSRGQDSPVDLIEALGAKAAAKKPRRTRTAEST